VRTGARACTCEHDLGFLRNGVPVVDDREVTTELLPRHDAPDPNADGAAVRSDVSENATDFSTQTGRGVADRVDGTSPLDHAAGRGDVAVSGIGGDSGATRRASVLRDDALARRVGFALLALGTLVVFWKMHGFKLPSQIAAEQAAKAGRGGPRVTLWTSITDWLSPWRWGRGNLLKSTTPAGGDMGAHVWTGDFVTRALFPKGRLTGWSDDWFFGMPVLNFYFPLPTLVISVLGKIIGYEVAFKLITVAGILTLPAASWLGARLAGLKSPIPTAMGLLSFIFLFGRNYDLFIYGGNILSTMAGEFSFSISMSLAIVFLGSFVRVLKTGEGRGRTAVLLAATGLCHLLPTMWAGLTAFFLGLAHLDVTKLRLRNARLFIAILGAGAAVSAAVAVAMDKNLGLIAFGLTIIVLALIDQFRDTFDLPQLRDAILTLAVGGAIAGFWLVPFKMNLPYTNDMGWEKSLRYIKFLFPFWAGKGLKAPADSHLIAVAMLFAAVGAACGFVSLFRAMIARARRSGTWSSISLPVLVILSCGFGLVLGAVRNDALAGVAGVLGALLIGFFLLIAVAERSLPQLFALFVPTLVLGAVALVYWGRPGLIILAAIPLVLSVLILAGVNRLDYERWPVAWSVMLMAIASVFTMSPQFRLWNARALPFWFFSILLLGGYGAVRSTHLVRDAVHWYAEPRRSLRHSTTWGISAIGLFVFIGVGLPLNLVPNALPIPKVSKGAIGVQLARQSNDSNQATGWASYNYAGYEGQGAWKEYSDLMKEAARVGTEHGCGRAMWEYEESKLGSFGTTLSLMLLPYWTGGCIGSTEGVYFESSATAPYHWLNAALLTAPTTNDDSGNKKYSGPSNPQRDLPYSSFDLPRGIDKLQAGGVRYYLALTDIAKAAADEHPDLEKVGTSGVFAFYKIADSELVTPLTEEPVVVTGVDRDQHGGWLDVQVEWYNAPDRYPTTIAWSGPSSWQRMPVEINKPKNTRTFGAGVVVPSTPQRKTLPQVAVRNIRQNNVDISFEVDRVGVPVVVKTSYFPNWKVKGAKGPYRVMPNFMVVIPTSEKVSLHYGYSLWDKVGYLATALGFLGVVLLRRTRKIRSFDAVSDPATLVASTPTNSSEMTAATTITGGPIAGVAADATDSGAAPADVAVSEASVSDALADDRFVSDHADGAFEARDRGASGTAGNAVPDGPGGYVPSSPGAEPDGS
jgi:hypothetical protein